MTLSSLFIFHFSTNLDLLNQSLRGICSYKKPYGPYVVPGPPVKGRNHTCKSRVPQGTVDPAVKKPGAGVPGHPDSQPSSDTYKLGLGQSLNQCELNA